MPYVKIEDGIFRNPKMVAVSSGAKLLYLAGICYSGSSLTDGFIPTNATRMLAADAGLPSPKKFIRELVDIGLWTDAPNGYQVHDYLEYNESSAKVQEKKAEARRRMAARRSQNNEGSSHDVRANNSRSSGEVHEPTTTTDTTTFSNEKDPPNPPRGDDDTPDDSEATDDLPYSPEFLAFIEAYPRRKGKGAAWKAWQKLKPSKALQRRMIEAVEAQKSWPQWRRDNGQYIPHPATWINQARWDDEPDQQAPPDQPKQWRMNANGQMVEVAS